MKHFLLALSGLKIIRLTGDVRDIVIKRKDIEWEVGLSIKHNHDAVKHSRLAISWILEMSGLKCHVLMSIGML